MNKINRVILIVLDSVGIGELPDAAEYNDTGSNTLGNIARLHLGFSIPNLVAMGLGNIDPQNEIPSAQNPTAFYGKANEQSAGKDTTTGHWEISGLILEKPFPTFPNGFPESFIKEFEKKIGHQTIGNKTASGTIIINELGVEHVKTHKPIVYTSADSVFQIAMHEDIFPIEEQYKICEIAREMLSGEMEVGRVIARPFVGFNGTYTRTSRRKDFAVLPPDNILDAVKGGNKEVYAIGKIVDIFAGKGISKYVKTANNQEGIDQTIAAIKKKTTGLIFTNLVDFDMHFGHRRDIPGYANALMEFDARLPEITEVLRPDDLLILTADHGNDPSAPGTDHTREYIPILNFRLNNSKGKNIGVRNSFADIAATIAEALEVPLNTPGASYLDQLR